MAEGEFGKQGVCTRTEKKKVSSLCCSIKYTRNVPDVFAENVQMGFLFGT